MHHRLLQRRVELLYYEFALNVSKVLQQEVVLSLEPSIGLFFSVLMLYAVTLFRKCLVSNYRDAW